MKQVLLFVVLAFCGLHCVAQRIRFTDTTNKWTMLQMFNDPESTYPLYAKYTRDTSIQGFAYHCLLVDYDLGYLALREDTSVGIIYFRFLTPTYHVYNTTDTAEHVLFDYRLKQGDTLKIDYTGIHVWASVYQTDSILLNNTYHKKWLLQPIGPNAANSTIRPYTFIEGIGTLNNPLYSLGDWRFEGQQQLRCFTSQGVWPSCSPQQKSPSYGYHQPPSWQIAIADSFDNTASCILSPVAIERFSSDNQIRVYPNPGHADIRLKMPAHIPSAIIRINDLAGRTIKEFIAGGVEIQIGQYLSSPGVYSYILQDLSTGKRYTGRFLFQ